MSKETKGILMPYNGKSNAITAKCASEAMGFPMEDTQSIK